MHTTAGANNKATTLLGERITGLLLCVRCLSPLEAIAKERVALPPALLQGLLLTDATILYRGSGGL
jgi:hypothetical protein